MTRLVLVILVLFSVSSLARSVSAYALPAEVDWAVASSEQCLEPGGATAEAPTFKPCGKKINGQAVPCQPLPAVLPAVMAPPAEMSRPRYAPAEFGPPRLAPLQVWYRPPRG